MFNRTLFESITAHPKTVLLCGALLVIAMIAGLPRLVKDTSIEAFVPADHPSLAANHVVRDTFGLTDAIAIAVHTEGQSIFAPTSLQRVAEITTFLQELDNVRSDRVVSLATESAIHGADGSVQVDPYIELDEDIGSQQAASAKVRLAAMPPHQNTLVSKDGTAAIIMGEINDITQAQNTYAEVMAFIDTLPKTGQQYHVAGPGAVSGYFSAYIEQDARSLLPASFVLVLLFVYLAFRCSSALLGPLVIIVGTVAGTLGTMAWLNIPYYAITNALPVVLIAIAVADAIHVLSAYYEARARAPEASSRTHAIDAMHAMARPVILTTLTTMAGFVGIGLVSVMPPIAAFAWFACFGSGLAGLLALLVLPNLLALIPPGNSKLFSKRALAASSTTSLANRLTAFANYGAQRPFTILGAFALCAVGAVLGATNLQIDRSQIDNFTAGEPIRIADEFMNKEFAGTAFLNVVVSADQDDALLQSRHMQAIIDLQTFIEQQSFVQKTVSIADYVSVLDAAIEERSVGDTRIIPTAEDAIAQYLLIYEASGSPTDFEEEIDPYYRTALIRVMLDAPQFSDNKATVENIQRYVDNTFNTTGLTATLAGDVNLTYHWMQQLIGSHFAGILVSLALVLTMASLVFRSVLLGLIAVTPVAFTVLTIYGVMGVLGINLEPPTSMFAAIAIGVGVDFAIHLVARLRDALSIQPGQLTNAIAITVPSTARACFFNACALTIGFAVLTISDLPTLQRFGGLISLAAFASFATSLLVIPALFALVNRPMQSSALGTSRPAKRAPAHLTLVGLVLICASPTEATAVEQSQTLSGLAIAQNIANRPVGNASTRELRMTLKDRRGRVRERLAVVHKLNVSADQRTRITYLEPKAVRNVGFLSHDFHAADKTDERWLYMPATRKVRRIPASDRGDYFLGTDFTFADMQSELKFELADYEFSNKGLNSDGLVMLTGAPTSQSTSKELGYGGFEALIDPKTWIPMRIEFTDRKGKPLKTVSVEQLESIDNFWSAQKLVAINHKTGHQTQFEFSGTQYHDQIESNVFNASNLSRGRPKS